jgi:hypothetical protein
MTQRREEAIERAVPIVILVVIIGWLAYSLGKSRGEEQAWERAEHRAVLVQLRGFCAASSAALAEAQDFATDDVQEIVLVESLAEGIMEQIEFRFPGRFREAQSGDRSADERWSYICSEPNMYGGSSLEGIEPDKIRPYDA